MVALLPSRLHDRVLICLVLSLGVALFRPFVARAANRDTSSPPLYEIIAVGRGRGEILLATLARPVSDFAWRFRKISVFPRGDVARDVVLSTSGTKALVVFSDGTPRVFDLTKRILSVDVGEQGQPQYRLPHQSFPYADQGKVCLLDDLGDSAEGRCKEAVAAAVHEDGHALYAFEDGRLAVTAPDGSQEQLQYRLPTGTQWQLLAGHLGDIQDFLVLVTDPAGSNYDAKGLSITKIVDPRHPEVPVAEYANPTLAALRAQLEFVGPRPTKLPINRTLELSEAELTMLVEHLEQQSSAGEFIWSFYRVEPQPELYAPVLEFAPGEPDYPSDVTVWNDIEPLARGTTLQAYEAAYASLGDRRWLRCTVYVRMLSYPGTWLMEYWYYYPFDEGKPHPHFHDSEHFFVEVDKLGGTVRNVFASDHDSLVPNNLYSTLVKGARPVALPLFATVELGKHAMAPDLDHDGRFTRGVDDNLHLEPYAVWGLRDLGAKRGHLMEPYTTGMSLPRIPDDRLSLSAAADLFPALDGHAGREVCRLETLPDDPPCTRCGVTTAEAGMSHLVDHPDARAPENIYKPYVLPWREVRVGVGIFEYSVNHTELSVALVGDLRHLSGGLARVPARLSLEYMWSHAKFNIPGQSGAVGRASMMYTGARLERMITNTQGFYFGVTPEWANISTRSANGILSPADPRWVYGGLWYRIGYILELPSRHKGNFTNQIGAMFQSWTVRFEWRVSFGVLRRRGEHEFGARRTDRNPYN